MQNCCDQEQSQHRNDDAASGAGSIFDDDDGLENGFNIATSESTGCNNRQSGSESEFFHSILQDTPLFMRHA